MGSAVRCLCACPQTIHMYEILHSRAITSNFRLKAPHYRTDQSHGNSQRADGCSSRLSTLQKGQCGEQRTLRSSAPTVWGDGCGSSWMAVDKKEEDPEISLTKSWRGARNRCLPSRGTASNAFFHFRTCWLQQDVLPEFWGWGNLLMSSWGLQPSAERFCWNFHWEQPRQPVHIAMQSSWIVGQNLAEDLGLVKKTRRTFADATAAAGAP